MREKGKGELIVQKDKRRRRLMSLGDFDGSGNIRSGRCPLALPTDDLWIAVG